MIRLDGIGHVLLRVSDVERSRAFYSTILGLKVVEEDPEHGGVFMALEGQGHTVDLFPVQNPETAPRSVAAPTMPPPTTTIRNTRAAQASSHAATARRS